MPEVNVALNGSPGELIFDPTAFLKRTVRALPAGTISGGRADSSIGLIAASGAAAVVAEAVIAEEEAAAGVAGLEGGLIAFPESVWLGASFDGAAVLLAEFEAVSAGLREQATSANSTKQKGIANESAYYFTEREFVEGKTIVQAGQPCK